MSPPQPGPGAEDPAVQVATTIPSVPHVNGVYAVLQALQSGNPLMGGYGYLQWSDAGGCWHEAADLNSMGGGDADLGAAVVTPLDGLVTDVMWWNGAMGFGNHLVVYLDDPRAAPACYLHVAHLDTMVVQPGERVTAGQPLGTCGKSGLQPYAHVHTAFWKTVPPGGWDFWQTGYSQQWVADHTHDPGDWFWASVTKAGEQSGGGVPPEDVAMLQDWQVSSWILGPLYAAAGIDFNPQSGTALAWVKSLRDGVYRGRPRTAEHPYGEGDQRGVWVEFELGTVLYRLSDAAVSWKG
jgi:hypothetical protein